MNTKPLPHAARQLTLREQRAEDQWSFDSPKLGRIVNVIGPLCVMQALTFEMDPDCDAYIERPRMLEVGNSQVEFHFWSRKRDGHEVYALIVPFEHAIEATTPRREHRKARELLEAAGRANIVIEFLFEHDIVQRHEAFRRNRHLLCRVQDAVLLPHRQAIVDELAALFRAVPRANIDQVCASLPGFLRTDVCAGIADLVHRGALVFADSHPISRFSLLEWRPAYAPA